jgi:hypothetical protein
VPYLDKERCLLQRNVALLDFDIVGVDEHFDACGCPVRAFPVLHGGNYVSLGFAIGGSLGGAMLRLLVGA